MTGILGMCGQMTGQPLSKTGPRWSIGFAGGGGVSAILNHNTFGFPELDYKPSAIQTVGLSVGYAPKPWGRIQLGMQIGRADYTYSQAYGPYEGCTETPISIRKEIGLKVLQIPLTYRHYFFNEEKLLAFNQAESRKELAKPQLFYLLGGFQVTVIRDAGLVLSKNSSSTGNNWEVVDLVDIKEGFDCFVPIDELPDHLPEDRKELFASTTLDAVLGAGLVMKLGPDLDIGLEGRGVVSMSDLNSAARNLDGRYTWRYQIHSSSDPEPYTQAFLASVTLFGVLTYSF
ncbi:MAG: hypothetical protein K9I85_05190 [Saprospiraceae bacterium]|nr:hypothetical protein [Saprospiraceae bacterium]